MARRLDRLESSFGLKPNTEQEQRMLERLEAGRRRVMAARGEDYFTRRGPREELPKYATITDRLALGRARARADWERRQANGEVG